MVLSSFIRESNKSYLRLRAGVSPVCRAWRSVLFAEGGAVSAEPGNNQVDGLTSKLYASGNDKHLGTVFEQRFYALRAEPGEEIRFPFAEQRFNALIDLDVPCSEKNLRETVLQLLKRGMRVGVCGGDGATQVGSIIDSLVDEYGFSHDGGTVYADVHHGEALEDMVGFFVTPNGLAEVGLIIVLGGKGRIEQASDAFRYLADGAAEELNEEFVFETTPELALA